MLSTTMLSWAITVAVQYTKIMYCLDVCTVPTYVPILTYVPFNICTVPMYIRSRRMNHPDECIIPMYVPSERMYQLAYVPSGHMFRLGICTVPTYVGCLAVTG